MTICVVVFLKMIQKTIGNREFQMKFSSQTQQQQLTFHLQIMLRRVKDQATNLEKEMQSFNQKMMKKSKIKNQRKLRRKIKMWFIRKGWLKQSHLNFRLISVPNMLKTWILKNLMLKSKNMFLSGNKSNKAFNFAQIMKMPDLKTC